MSTAPGPKYVLNKYELNESMNEKKYGTLSHIVQNFKRLLKIARRYVGKCTRQVSGIYGLSVEHILFSKKKMLWKSQMLLPSHKSKKRET